MSSLKDRLKLLGVKQGAESILPPKQRATFPIEDVVEGRYIYAHGGGTFVSENFFSPDYRHGHIGLYIHTPLQVISKWAGSKEIANNLPGEFAFLDTETSGLSGGTGTFAFMVGVGRLSDQGFQLAQFFMPDPLDEPALLLALEEFLAPCKTLVTFNGKSFDSPLLNTRYTLQGWISPLTRMSHIDLIHLSRRLWRDRLPSRTLSNLEVQILGAKRKDEEIPGWMIPQIYFDYLKDRDARPLIQVFYHNLMDVVSMVALLNLLSHLIEKSELDDHIPGTDQAAMARIYEDLGYLDQAERAYVSSLDSDLTGELRIKTILCLASLRKRRGSHEQASPLWEEAANEGSIEAYIELAKYYEHRVKDIPGALYWTQAALNLIDMPGYPQAEHMLYQNDLEHRLQRLKRKQEKGAK